MEMDADHLVPPFCGCISLRPDKAKEKTGALVSTKNSKRRHLWHSGFQGSLGRVKPMWYFSHTTRAASTKLPAGLMFRYEKILDWN
jgi:hypothetical protein